MNIEKLCACISNGNKGVTNVSGLKVNDSANPLDALTVPDNKAAENAPQKIKHHIMLLDEKAAKEFSSRSSREKKMILSRLSDSDRRRFLKMVRDTSKAEENNAKYNKDLYSVLLTNAVGSTSEKDLDLLQDFVKNNKSLPKELLELADCVIDLSFDFSKDSDKLNAALPLLDNKNEVSQLFQTTFGDQNATTEVKTADSIVQIPKSEEEAAESTGEENDGVVAEDEGNVYVDEKNIESSENIEDSVNDIKTIAKLVNTSSMEKIEKVIDHCKKLHPSLSDDTVRIAVMDSALSKVCDSFADDVAANVEEAINEAGGDVNLINVFTNALNAFAEGDSEPLNAYVNAHSVTEVADLLVQNSGDPDAPIEENPFGTEEEDQENAFDDEENPEEGVDTPDPDMGMDDDFSDVEMDEFNPNELEDSLKLAKCILHGKFTQKLRDAVCATLPIVNNIPVPEDNFVNAQPYNEMPVVSIPMGRDEYCTAMAGDNTVECATKNLFPFNCPNNVDDVTTDGTYIIMVSGDDKTNLTPIEGSCEDVVDSLKGIDKSEWSKVLSEKCVRVRDCKKVAKIINRLDYIDNRYYKKHFNDSEWSFAE